MSKRVTKLPRVELLNVPSFRQGSFDSLCTYYTAAMMLTTLFPEYTSFGETTRTRTTSKVSNDPIISNYSDEDDRLVLARWFYLGEYVRKATTILNKIMKVKKRSARFACRDETVHDNTFRDVIVGSINEGLPVMLGWSTADYDSHTVLVTGYWEGRERWLLTNDPVSGADQISWDSLKRQRTSKFEIGLCKPNSHDGYRPLKRCESAKRGSQPVVSRWTQEGYRPVDQDFA